MPYMPFVPFFEGGFQQNDPAQQGLFYTPQQRSGLPPEFQGYIDPSSIQTLLKGARRDAIAQGLIGAGASLIGAPDLSTGLSQGATAFASPFFDYKQMERELPIQMAQARYGFAGEEEQRQRQRQKSGMEEAEFPYDLSEKKFQHGTQGLRREGLMLGNALSRLGVNAGQMEYGHLADKLEDAATERDYELKKMKFDLDHLLEEFNAAMRLRAAQTGGLHASAFRDWTYVPSSEGGITTSQKIGLGTGTGEDVGQRINAGNLPTQSKEVQIGDALLQKMEETSSITDPNQLMELFPEARTVDAVMVDVASGMPEEELRRKWMGDPVGRYVVERLLWDRERDMGPAPKLDPRIKVR